MDSPDSKHKLLARQLAKAGLEAGKAPSAEQWADFLAAVDRAYRNFDEGRYLLERALDVSSKEMKETMEKQKEISLQLVQTSKMASLGTLASGIAHELNNPLAGILGHAEILEASAGIPAGERVNITRIIALTERAAVIVKQLLKLARKPTEKEQNTVSLLSVINETLEMGASKIRYDNVNLEINIADPSILVHGDSHRLISVFQNLINNSFDEFQRMDQSTGRQPHITIGLDTSACNDREVTILFKDNAGGIPPQIIQNVFDPFFTTKDVGSGTGLGLTLVRNIMEELGGSISVSSEGVETTFSIRLKREKSVDRESPAESAEIGSVRFGKPGNRLRRVLIVDDEPDLLAVLSTKLRGQFEISSTDSPTDAITLIAEGHYDLLISDLRMPTFSGKDLIELARKTHPHLAVCMMSGHAHAASESFNDESMKSVVFIEKPFPPLPELLKLIERAFEIAPKAFPAAA